jgi:hypothetical protein
MISIPWHDITDMISIPWHDITNKQVNVMINGLN